MNGANLRNGTQKQKSLGALWGKEYKYLRCEYYLFVYVTYLPLKRKPLTYINPGVIIKLSGKKKQNNENKGVKQLLQNTMSTNWFLTHFQKDHHPLSLSTPCINWYWGQISIHHFYHEKIIRKLPFLYEWNLREKAYKLISNRS